MSKVTFVTNALGSDDWLQIYLDDILVWERSMDSIAVESLAEFVRKTGSPVEIEYVTDDEMEESS